MFATADESLKFIKDNEIETIDLKFERLRVHLGRKRRRGCGTRSDDGLHRSVSGAFDLEFHLQHGHGRCPDPVRPRPPGNSQAGRGLPAQDGHRRPGLVRAGVRVQRLRSDRGGNRSVLHFGRIADQRGYMGIPPADQLHDLRGEIVAELEGMGIPVRYHHHEVGASGQCEIEVELNTLVRAADSAQITKYVVKNVAARRGKIATFMPKPVYGEAGNGMHVHQKLVKGGQHLFYDTARQNYADLSDTALHYVAGLLEHGPALTALTNPSTNSFKRLVDGHEAPVGLFFALANRSAAIRVPRYASTPQEKRIEYRPPDFTGNIYLTLAAMLMAGLDGIKRKIDPAARNFGPFDVDIAAQDEDFRRKIAMLPRSPAEAMAALGADHEFLCQGEVFSESFFPAWRRMKLDGEVRQVAGRPHPFEYCLYLDT